MSSDWFDSSSTLYECIMFSKICFGYILSYIGISELACIANAYQLIGLYMSSRGLSWINFQLCNTFLCFVLGINSYTLCLMIAEVWNFKLHIYIYIHIHMHKNNQLYCMWPLWTSKNHIFFHTDILRNYIPSSVYVCVWKIHVENLVFTANLQ